MHFQKRTGIHYNIEQTLKLREKKKSDFFFSQVKISSWYSRAITARAQNVWESSEISYQDR